MAENEVLVRIRGSGVAAVLHLIDTGQLRFDVVSTRHHGPDLKEAAIKKIAERERLRDALVYATRMGCVVTFRHGHTVRIDVDHQTILVGVDSDPEEVARLIGGNLRRTAEAVPE